MDRGCVWHTFMLDTFTENFGKRFFMTFHGFLNESRIQNELCTCMSTEKIREQPEKHLTMPSEWKTLM